MIDTMWPFISIDHYRDPVKKSVRDSFKYCCSQKVRAAAMYHAWMQWFEIVELFKIKIQINPSNELQCVTANLTLHMMSKIEFQPEFRNPQMLSFPNMYNTMGSKMDGLAVREHLLSKNAEKTAFLGLTILDQPTLERAGTHNFRD